MRKKENPSRVSDDRVNTCYLCGRVGQMHLHHIFEGSTRNRCDKDRLTVHLCVECHSWVHSSKGYEERKYLHQMAQEIFEAEIGTREDFIREYIKSYL